MDDTRGTALHTLPAQAEQRVLVVDDDATVRDVLHDVLKVSGYEVELFEEGDAAIEALRNSSFGAALVDLTLPGRVQGLDVIACAAEEAPLVQCIVMTAQPTLETAVEALRLGAVDYVSKPVDVPLFQEKVRKALERHRLASENALIRRNFETLFEAVPGIVWFMTQDGVFRRFNEEGARLLGYGVDELVDQSYKVLSPRVMSSEGDAQWVFSERRTGMRATRRRDVELRDKDGVARRFEITATGAYEPEAPGSKRALGTFGVGWDITEQVHLEEQLHHAQKMDALGRLAGGVAHDFNNMLTVVASNARLLRSDLPSDAPERELVIEILDASERAAALTQQLLTFSRKQVVTAQPIEIDRLVSDLDKMLGRVIDERIELSFTPGASAARVNVDPGQLEQILLNLAINARDSMPGGGRLSVATRVMQVEEGTPLHAAGLSSGDHVEIAVSDSGAGMSEEVRAQVFEPFFTTKGPRKGTGLGLSVAYGIVKQHRGHIDVESIEGGGSTFRIWLPVTRAPATVPTRRITESLRLGGETVLLVEDEPMVRRSLKRALERQDYVVIEASDGLEALAMVESSIDKIDVLVTDIIMPNLTGPALAKRLRSLKPALRVVFISGYAGDEHGELDLGAPGVAYMQKPLQLGAFLDLVRQVIDIPEEEEL